MSRPRYISRAFGPAAAMGTRQPRCRQFGNSTLLGAIGGAGLLGSATSMISTSAGLVGAIIGAVIGGCFEAWWSWRKLYGNASEHDLTDCQGEA